MQTRTKIVIVVTIIALAGITVAALKQDVFALSSKDATPQAVLATVNRQPITAADVEPLMSSGMVKPVAIENAVNRTLTAEAARHLWPADAQALADSVARQALSELYVRKKLAELQKAVLDAEINRYYETNVTDEMYSGHVLKYYLTQDAKDATEVAEAVKQGSGESLAKFSWVSREGDHAVLPAGVPYGLYQQVKGMQPGQFLGPFRARDGLLFLKLEERKAGKRPELAKVTEEIRGLLAQQRLESALKELRDQASIQLK